MSNTVCPLTNEARIEALCDHLHQQFYFRTKVEDKKHGFEDKGLALDITVKSKVLWLTFSNGKESHSVTIPIPYVENGVVLVSNNEVKRATCKYFLRDKGLILDYIDVMHRIIDGSTTGILPPGYATKTHFLRRVINSFKYGNTATIVYNMQRAVNEVLNKMPLHETDLNSWVMNRRLFIIDPVFGELSDPASQLEYQVQKNEEFFPLGWTSMGMSDGSLASKNYILTTDTRKLTPFGIKHHNPGRNLYSTYGMKGDELPLIRSRSMQDLMDQGIARTGWNLFTLFVDVPDAFEDQIMVDKSHLDKYTTYERRYQCFGNLLIKEGDRLRRGTQMSIAPDGEVKVFDLDASNVKVTRIIASTVNVGGVEEDVHNVVVTYRRYFKDGTKFTNLHGNKGVVRFKDLGHAVDPRTGQLRKIDVIVSCTSVKKRKNYGQILEAVLNTLNDEQAMVYEDDAQCSLHAFEQVLEGKGLPKDGTWVANTYMGELTGVCGTVFWGVIAQPEGSLWGKGSTTKKNGRELRTAGLKFSTVEFRALNTRFGRGNPVTDEIMSYSQGTEDLHEEFEILRTKRGQSTLRKPTVDVRNIRAVNQIASTIMNKEDVSGTVVDEMVYPNGFYMMLPVTYQTAVDKNVNVVSEGFPRPWAPDEIQALELSAIHHTNFIYVPSANLKKCWRHDTGKYGLSEIGVLVNNIVVMSHRVILRPQDEHNFVMLNNAIKAYYARVSRGMGTKKGVISTYGMAVRYPYSAKAYASLSNRLPKNTIEIHKSMAKSLRVKNGDVVMVERFPCLGFMSLRPQKVRVTTDPMCKYTIRVSGNSLGSLSLDFDGDVLFVASFHTPEAKDMLRKERANPNKSCYDIIKILNKKAGVPHIKCMTLEDYQIHPFENLDSETHAELVRRVTGVKSHTGPVIALAYNVMRLMENSKIKYDQKTNVAIEVFLDKVGNSVFKQKHGVKSLHDIVIDAVCMADIEMLVEHGFNRGTSTIICNIIKEKAQARGVFDLVQYHRDAKEKGFSNIINRMVREDNKIYFASRADLEACKLLSCVEQPVVDVPSETFAWTMSGRANTIVTPLETHRQEDALKVLNTPGMRDATKMLHQIIDDAFIKQIVPAKERKSVDTSAMHKMINDFRRASLGIDKDKTKERKSIGAFNDRLMAARRGGI
jgi:hypothetical protein